MDISLIITLHDEGEQARPTLLAASRARNTAAEQGFAVEIVLSVDRGSESTYRVVEDFQRHSQDQILHLDIGDVGANRNAAVAASRGRFVAICDGDDMFSANFLEVGAAILLADPRQAIIRPQVIVQFDQTATVGWQIGSDSDQFDPRCLVVVNPWTTGCMARRSLFEAVPYWVRGADHAGLGFEDWHWNCETLALGAVDIIAPETAQYVRIKAAGSMNAHYIGQSSLPPPSRLFETLT